MKYPGLKYYLASRSKYCKYCANPSEDYKEFQKVIKYGKKDEATMESYIALVDKMTLL